jgi:hypothetical protein
LIDNDNIVKWIGNPKFLNNNLLNDFVNNRVNVEKKDKIDVINEINCEEGNFEKSLKIFSNYDIDYYFSLKKSEKKSTLNHEKVGKRMFYLENISFRDILKKVLDYNENQIVINDSIVEKNSYIFIYKNINHKNIELIETDIMNNLGLEKKIIRKIKLVNKIKLSKKNKLEISNDEYKNTTFDGKKVLYSGFTIKELISEINKWSNDFYVFDNLDKKKYNFFIDLSSSVCIQKSIESYGFNIVKAEKEIDVYVFSKIK